MTPQDVAGALHAPYAAVRNDLAFGYDDAAAREWRLNLLLDRVADTINYLDSLPTTTATTD